MRALKFAKPRPSLLTKRDKAKAELAEERRVRAAVKRRDAGMCRVCFALERETPFALRHGNQMHHILPRSLGGRDTTQNCIWICDQHHRERHAGVIRITGSGDGAISVEKIWE